MDAQILFTQTLGMSYITCWGRVEELLVARAQEIKHTKIIFFPSSYATTCVHRPLGVDQRTPKTHGCLNTLHPNPRNEFYNLLGSCGGALGGWRAGDQAYQAHLLPRFVCYDLCKSSTWSRPKVFCRSRAC
ncbi:hypothetical protein Taro_043298 [Colocasia esculenta]|uniref:Uncharacterized protein n=1 Tax=Colocasia esculenta TaxID=4460 RepID=A0A843X3W4_COLES|nr:hypothetical protein [Colocasia esculenta]